MLQHGEWICRGTVRASTLRCRAPREDTPVRDGETRAVLSMGRRCMLHGCAFRQPAWAVLYASNPYGEKIACEVHAYVSALADQPLPPWSTPYVSPFPRPPVRVRPRRPGEERDSFPPLPFLAPPLRVPLPFSPPCHAGNPTDQEKTEFALSVSGAPALTLPRRRARRRDTSGWSQARPPLAEATNNHPKPVTTTNLEATTSSGQPSPFRTDSRRRGWRKRPPRRAALLEQAAATQQKLLMETTQQASRRENVHSDSKARH